MSACRGAGCRQLLVRLFAERGIEASVSQRQPLVPSPYPDLGLSCPHGVRWYAEPTSEQRAAWARDGCPVRRGGPIARRAPLDRGSALRRVALLRRWRLPVDPVWSAVRRVVWARCGGRCEFSGERLDPATWQCHHRKFRSRGGQHSAANAVALTPTAHRGVHRRGQRIAEERGFVVGSTADPSTTPVRLFDGRLVRLTSTGGYAPVRDEESA